MYSSAGCHRQVQCGATAADEVVTTVITDAYEGKPKNALHRNPAAKYWDIAQA